MNVPPPPKRRKGAPPPADDTPGALTFNLAEPPAPPKAASPKTPTPKRDTPLNFRVESSTRRRFARRAFDLDIDQVELLEALIDLYLDDPRVEDEVRARLARKRSGVQAR